MQVTDIKETSSVDEKALWTDQQTDESIYPLKEILRGALNNHLTFKFLLDEMLLSFIFDDESR